MLKQLYIKNFTLIDELDIQLHQGFSVITGETGAGKSIILGAIGLLLGNRADTKAIKAGCDRCTIEAHFDLSRYDMQSFFAEHDIDYDADDTIIRRELTAAGKSRAFINDTPVSLSLMRELGESLVDIHSQHQNLLLQKEDFQLNVVDIIAQDTPASSPFVYGEAITSTRWVPPADWPKAVILSGSPPKAAMLALTHRRPSRISRLPLPESPPLSLRKPSTFTR